MTSLFSLTGLMVNQGNHPQIASRFWLVQYYNLPRYINIVICVHKSCIYIYIHMCLILQVSYYSLLVENDSMAMYLCTFFNTIFSGMNIYKSQLFGCEL